MKVKYADSLNAAITDVLWADGGWMSSSLLCDEVDGKDPSIKKALHRMNEQGYVESRPTFQRQGSHQAGLTQPESEYRITHAGIARFERAVAA